MRDIALILSLACLPVFGVARAQDLPMGVGDAPIENLRVPLELYESGSVKTQVVAGRARVGAKGAIYATDVRIEFYTESGELDGLVVAESCEVDREEERVTSTSKIRFERQGVEVSGMGFEWQAQEESFKILERAKVVFNRSLLPMSDLNLGAGKE